MEPQSPPKRMTRSRAAAKADSSSIKTTKIVTAAARAKASRTATASTSTTTTATKRKTRSDDVDDVDDDDDDELQVDGDAASLAAAATKNTRATRGRAKKTTDPEPAPEPVSKPRGRPKKTADSVQDEPVKAPRTTRTRKTTQEDQPEAVPEPAKKTTRGRVLASTATKPALKTAVKKTVTFQEPEKENIAPKTAIRSTNGKTSVGEVAQEKATGLRAKPVRRIASATTRATRATRANSASSSGKEPRPSPLSPKKVSQMSLNKADSKADSDDELATSEKTPIKPMARAPIKPLAVASKPVEPVPSTSVEEDTEVVNSSEVAHGLLLRTPAKRMPASPWKDSMKSPARKVDVLPPVPHSVARPGLHANEPHLKASLLQSPAKRSQSPFKGLEKSAVGALALGVSPFKTSLLSSPAKRPMSPIKFPSNQNEDDYDTMRTPAPKSVLLSTPIPTQQDEERLEEYDLEELQLVGQAQLLDPSLSSCQVEFPGRMSSVLPRSADPSMATIDLPLTEMQEESEDVDVETDAQAEMEADGEEEFDDEVGDAMILDEPVTVLYNPSPSKLKGPMYRLRDTHANDVDSESEDELASSSPRAMFGAAPTTPSLFIADGRTDGASQARSTSKRLRLDAKFGFTPLAQQLSSWNVASPLKTGTCAKSPSPEPTAATEDALSAPLMEQTADVHVSTTPSRETFFDDEMVARDEGEECVETKTPEIEELIFDDMPVTEEDVALAAEAHEMSLLEPEQIEVLVNDNVTPDDSESQASQEYGDENEVPIDPKLLSDVPPVTPRRFVRREFHTVSKVPLKAADEGTPRPRMKKRSHSIARLPVQRPTKGLTRNATVISYSPTKDSHDMEETRNEQRGDSAPPVTPSEAGWSTAGTPARTPRHDLKPDLLRGAVVHVDVHTSEGADASGIFIELLAQMGARCVKNWPWNPSSPPGHGGPSSSSKVGITHVVYKDGGKRTLEKVRETGGVVQCVGVSWVLDCERENKWLDEAPYYVDTSLVPRGGARRRKSMEPKALANLNGKLVSTPSRSTSLGAQRESHTTPANSRRARRESGLWELTPEDPNDETTFHDGGEHDGSAWDKTILTPVPKTPAPEAIARYVNTVSPETASEDDEDQRIKMIMRTCPPKPNEYRELGEGILRKEKDEGVLMRLMAARRKSLQFAPKVGSPLARAWK